MRDYEFTIWSVKAPIERVWNEIYHGKEWPASKKERIFRVFQHLFTQAGGDLIMVHEAISQLSRIYCIAALPSWEVRIEDETVPVKREVQTDLLPSKEALDKMPLSDFVRRELESLARLPADWERLGAIRQSSRDYHIYGFDEQ
ncbi:MAG TPA: hypothetical protein VFD75_17045 [Pyrinomonadaceae bacterium]|nr:hypothetical protein [Pyrinomonadaceae bacterium]